MVKRRRRGVRVEASPGAVVRESDRVAVVVPSAAVPKVVSASQYELDLAVACLGKKCDAAIGAPCVGLDRGVVHFGRRLRRLLLTVQVKRRARPRKGKPAP